MKGLRESLSDCIDCVLSVRDDMGAALDDVSIIERTWAGERVGDGSFADVMTPLRPTPQIRDYSHDVRVSEAGSVKQGDLILVGISRNLYTEPQLRTDVDAKNKEKLIKVGRHFYRTIHVKEKLVTWDIHIRKVNQDETEE